MLTTNALLFVFAIILSVNGQKIGKDTIAPVGALLAVLLTQFTISKVKERELLDDHWQKFAITEGIEPLLAFMSVLHHRITKHIGFDRVPEIAPYPIIALQHVKIICPARRIDSLLMHAQQVDEYGVPGNYLREFTDCLYEVHGLLINLARDISDIKLEKKVTFIILGENPKLSLSQLKLIN